MAADSKPMDIEEEVERIKEEKVRVVRSQRYEEAAKLRDTERNLNERLDAAKKKWEEENKTVRVTVTDEHVGDNVVTLTVTDNYGNTSTCDAIVTVEAGLGVDNISLNTIRLHPNPTSDIINISGNFSGLSFIVYDLLGKKIFKGNTSRIIDTSKLDKGIYLIEFSLNNQKAVRKIIKN